MDFEEHKRIVLHFLRENGRATNRRLIRLLGGDAELYEEVKEELILDDLARDKDGVGLVYAGSDAGPAGESPAAATEASPPPAEQDAAALAAEPSPAPRGGVFISYGRADAEELALRLEADLVHKGYTVWLDKQRMRSGKSWEEQIEAAILRHDVFVALLTPHAVRRPDGVCLDEISLARYNERKIVPLMVMPCRPPLGIYRLDWVDFTHWMDPARYQAAFSRLEKVVEEEAVVEGVHSDVFSQLKPLDFGVEVARHVKGFVGREWLLDRVDEWLSDSSSRAFFLIGDPGTGKSAFLANLVHRHPLLLAYHFCVSSLADSLDPFRFVRSIACQLATQLESYRSALRDLSLEAELEDDPGAYFRRLVADPLKAEHSDAPRLLLVDALDESLGYGQRNIARVILERLEDLPPWIRVVASSRRETELLDLFGRYSPVEIDTSSSENRRDIDAYMDKRFAEPDFVQRMASAHADADSIRRLLGGRSRGNFLYVAQTMEALAAGRIDPLAPDTVPDGLVGIYHSFFDRIFPGARGYDSLRAILDVLVAAREPVTAGLVAACLDSSVFDVEKRLEPVAAFFPQRSGRYQAYHKSVLDWLAGRAGHNLAFRVDLVGGHRKIAGALLKRFQAGDWGEDVLAHLPFHLVEGGMWDEVTDLLTALEFIAAKAAGGEVHGLVRDFQMALSKLPEAADEAARETENRDRRREFASSLAALSRGEDVELEVVHAPAPEELAGGGRKLGLSAGSSRQTRLRAFAQFAGVHRHALARFAGFPGFVAQHAYNAAGDGPVARAAEEALSAAGLSPHVRVSSRHRGAFVPYPALLHTLEGHGSYIESIDISADGQRIVSAGADEQTARVWDLQTGACLAVLSGHEGRVCSVSVSADGRVAASGSWDRTIRVWDLESGEEVARLQGHEAHTAVHLSPDGQRLLSGGEDGALRLWDVRTATFRSLRDAGLTRVTAVAASADSRIALCGTEDGTVEVWDSRQGTRSRVLAGHSDRVSSIAVTPDGSRALSGGWDRQIRLWDLQSGKAIATLEGHAEAVLDVAISADGNVGASVASSKGWRQSDNLVWLWDLRTGRCIKKLGGHVDRINCVALDVDARRAATGGWDRTVRVWDVERGGGAPTLSGHMEIVNTLCVAGDTGKVVSCSNDETVRVWNMETQDDEQTLEGHSHWVNSAVLAPDGETILSGGHDAVVRRWNLATGGSLPPLVRLPYAVSSLALAEAGRVIVACLAPEVFVVDLASGDVVGTLKGHKDHVNAVAISPAGTLAATASNDGSIRLWSVPERSCRKVLEGHRGPVRTIAFSPDGGELCSGGSDGAVVVWNIARGQPVHTLVGHSGPVASVRSLDGGALLLSSGWDGTFRVWNLRRGECIAIYQAEGAVRCISERVGEWKVLLGLSTGRIVEIELWNMPDGKNPEPA